MRVHRVAEADDDLLARDARADVRLGLRPGCRSGFWISKATSLAPPCLGPRSAPIAPVMQEYMSEPVPAMTRAVKVEALNSCSAYRMSEVCMARTQDAGGGRAVQQVQEMAAHGVVVGLDLDAPAGVAEVVPVAQHRAEARPPAGRRCRARRRRRARPSPAARSRAPRRRCASRPSGALAAGSASSAARTAAGRPRSALQLAPCRRLSSARVRQLAVDQEIGDLLELAPVGDLQDVVAAVVQVVAGAPTVQSAVLPAVTPDSATDFFGLNAGASLMSLLMASSFRRTTRRASSRTRGSRAPS